MRTIAGHALVAVVVLLTLSSNLGANFRGSTAHAAFYGDFDCDGDVDLGDVISELELEIGIRETGSCAGVQDGIDCDEDLDLTDALLLLSYIGDVPVTLPPGCPPIEGIIPGTTNEQLASDFAAWISNAPDDEARYRALLRIFDELHMGVYTAEGGEVQQGAERGPGDFYFYDFELQMMAASLGRGDTGWGVEQIAGALDQTGYREDGEPFTARDLRDIIEEATNDALENPAEGSSLSPLLVRELGLRHHPPYDLADHLGVHQAPFDPLQLTLIIAGLTLPIIEEEGPVDVAASSLIESSNNILRSQPLAGIAGLDCSDFKGEGQELWGPSKYFITAIKVIGSAAKIATVAIDSIHGSILAFSVEVKALDAVLAPTHLDHGSEAGQPLKFRIFVNMRDDLGEFLVKCGWLLTADFPAKGPIKDVRVSFDTSIQEQLKNYGTLDCTGLFCSRMTGADGIATLTFDPKDEKQPYGVGLQREASGVVSGTAWYQSKFKNVLGAIAQFLAPKYGSTRWFVQYHGPCFTIPESAPGSISIEGFSSIEELPCRWTGTAQVDTHHFINTASFYDEVGHVDTTFTFGNPRAVSTDSVRYEIIGGDASWQASGWVADPVNCTFEMSGTNDISGSLFVIATENGLRYSLGGGIIGQNGHLSHACQGDGYPTLATTTWVSTCTTNPGGLPLSEQNTGNCTEDHPHSHDVFSWSFSSTSCAAAADISPQGGVCQASSPTGERRSRTRARALPFWPPPLHVTNTG